MRVLDPAGVSMPCDQCRSFLKMFKLERVRPHEKTTNAHIDPLTRPLRSATMGAVSWRVDDNERFETPWTRPAVRRVSHRFLPQRHLELVTDNRSSIGDVPQVPTAFA